MKGIKCPVCQRNVKPIKFTLWTGMGVDVCPNCRIGLGILTDSKIKAAGKRLAKVHKP